MVDATFVDEVIKEKKAEIDLITSIIMIDPTLVSDRYCDISNSIRRIADENEGIENLIFEEGIKAIVPMVKDFIDEVRRKEDANA